MEIVLQTLIFGDDVCDENELFFRTEDKEKIHLHKGKITLMKDALLQTDTYMNMFDASFWSKYTSIKKWKLCIEMKGHGHIFVCESTMEGIKVIGEGEVASTQFIKRNFNFLKPRGMIFFKIHAKSDLIIKKAYYCAETQAVNHVHLSLAICTYKREKQVLKTINSLEQSLFFQEKSQFYHGLSVRVIDNGSSLKRNTKLKRDTKDYIKIYSNKNNGGSGGFTKGILESRKDKNKFGINRIIFMDDDVEIIPETLYRLFALLQLVIPLYEDCVISGRMFRMDDRAVQYTASEIWNRSNIQHVGYNLDMRKIDNVCDMNGEKGEYAGWWFACYPMWFTEKNLPLPFFLHCDDVEYGLRYGGKVLVLNGIQVWHETYEYRKSPLITYYDMRNSMIVRTLYESDIDCHKLYDEWKQRLDESFRQKDYEKAYALIKAFEDYLKGREAFFASGNKIKKISAVKVFMRYRAAVRWRIVYYKYKKRGNKAFKSYKIMEINGDKPR